MIGDYFRTLLANGGKQIALWHRAQTLIPGVVGRRKVGFNIVITTQLLAYLVQ